VAKESPVKKKPRKLGEDRIDEAISGFQETLLDFCAALLSSGSRNGKEWVVPDLDNSPRHDGRNGSCCVNLETGCFYDHNPTTKPHQGGPVDLWRAIFGVDDFVEVILGMEQWVKDGSLPGGGSAIRMIGKPKVTDPEGETSVPRDGTERHWLENIQSRREDIERTRRGNIFITKVQWDLKPTLESPSYDESLVLVCREGSDDFLVYAGDSDKGESLHEYLSRGNNYQKEIERQVAHSESLIRSAYSKIQAHRWRTAVEETQAMKEEAAEFLAEYRGLSPTVFLWMINNGYVALYTSQRSSVKTGNRWQDTEIAFPVARDGKYPGRRLGFRITPDGKWPWQSGVRAFYRQREGGVPADLYKPDLEFLGMHLKWFGATGKSGWRYEPKGNGCGSVPFIIGDLPAAELLVIGESTWDVISFIDLYTLYERGPDHSWAAIDTGGASNAARIPVDQIRPDATILLLLQNDQNKANDRWCEALPLSIRERGRLIAPPGEIKDLNDWMKTATREEVKQILEHK
jgi:hypothetical protein